MQTRTVTLDEKAYDEAEVEQRKVMAFLLARACEASILEISSLGYGAMTDVIEGLEVDVLREDGAEFGMAMAKNWLEFWLKTREAWSRTQAEKGNPLVEAEEVVS